MQVQQGHNLSPNLSKSSIYNTKYHVEPTNHSLVMYKIRLQGIKLTKNGQEN